MGITSNDVACVELKLTRCNTSGSANGTQIVGWQGKWNDTSAEHQHWNFNCQSITGGQVHEVLKHNPYLEQDFRSYLSDGLCVKPSRILLQSSDPVGAGT